MYAPSKRDILEACARTFTYTFVYHLNENSEGYCRYLSHIYSRALNGRYAPIEYFYEAPSKLKHIISTNQLEYLTFPSFAIQATYQQDNSIRDFDDHYSLPFVVKQLPVFIEGLRSIIWEQTPYPHLMAHYYRDLCHARDNL